MGTIFFSYSRVDSQFVLKLAKDLRDTGVNVWLDQLDIAAGSHWDSSIEKALHSSKTLLIILSATSVASENVMDEVSYALEEGKKVIPILLSNCETPFRLRRLQRIDFTGDYQSGFDHLLEAINVKETNRAEKINTISETIHKANSPKTEATATLPAKPNGKSKMGILITIGVIILAFAAWGISKMGGKKNEDESKELNASTSKPDQTPDSAYIIDKTNYYFIENRFKGYLMATTDSSLEDGADIVTIKRAEGENDNMKFELSGLDPYMLIVKHSGKCVTVYDGNFLGQSIIPNNVTSAHEFRFVKFKEGYFQIEDRVQVGNVLGLDRASEDSEFGQKVISMKNDSSLHTQWKLIPSGDKLEN